MLVYTYDYDTAYAGPALPVVEIEISSSVPSENRLLLRALVDSGADATMIPVRYLNRLDIVPVDQRRVRSSADISYLADIFTVALRVGPFFHAALRVVGNRQSRDVILGRDVLNHMIVTLNGLAQVVELTN